MPECGIGLVPDVGGSHFLPRLSGQLGMFLALTGSRLKGWDCLHAGIATHAVDNDNMESLEADLLRLGDGGVVRVEDVQTVLDSHTDKSAYNGTSFSLAGQLEKIDEIFSGGSVEEIMQRYSEDGSDWSLKQLKTMSRLSPTSVKVSYRQVREGGMLHSLAECLNMEYRLVRRCCEDKDFYEGVRAAIIDKDNSPKWSPATLDEVTEEVVDRYFSSLGEEELRL